MARYVAFLRGVSPMNLRMPDLKSCLEAAGCTNVRTLLSSGNVAFDARSRSLAALQARAEQAMRDQLGRVFVTIVRPSKFLQEFVASDPFAEFALPPEAKPIVTFLLGPPEHTVELPIERDGSSILKLTGNEVLAAYLPGSGESTFMSRLERTFGKSITTRTFETVRKCAKA